MRKTYTSVAALGLAFTVPTAVLAQDMDQQAFTDAGFENVQVMSEIEVARVDGDDGTTFYVVSGMGHGMSGMDASGGMTASGGLDAGGAEITTPDVGAGGASDLDTGTTPDTGAGTPPAAGSDTGTATGTAPDTATGDTDAATGTPGDTGTSTTTDLTGSVQSDPAVGMDTDADTDADTGAGTSAMAGSSGMGASVSLEEQLTAAGIENFEIISDVMVGQLSGEGGHTLYVLHGLDE